MNHFSYEFMGKDRIKTLQQEGMTSQASQTTGKHKFQLLHGLPKLILLSLVVLGLLNILMH